MIKQIVKDPSKHLYEPIDEIIKKLDYFRKLSAGGLNNLSNEEFAKVGQEIAEFFNVSVAFFTDTYPTKLFRITNNKALCDGKSQKLQKVSQLIGPPIDKANYNRCNLPNESVFYAALDVRTAIWETQPQVEDYITLSEWKIKDGQRLNTHSIFHPELTNLNTDSHNAYEQYIEAKKKIDPHIGNAFHEILKFMTEEFMKPVSRGNLKDYFFSALLSSRILQSPPNEDGFRIDSISYPSVKMEYGLTNLAILNSVVLEKLDLVSITLWSIAETNYDKANVMDNDVIKISEPQYKITDFDFDKDKIVYDPSEELRLVMEMLEKQKLK